MLIVSMMMYHWNFGYLTGGSPLTVLYWIPGPFALGKVNFLLMVNIGQPFSSPNMSHKLKLWVNMSQWIDPKRCHQGWTIIHNIHSSMIPAFSATMAGISRRCTTSMETLVLQWRWQRLIPAMFWWHLRGNYHIFQAGCWFINMFICHMGSYPDPF